MKRTIISANFIRRVFLASFSFLAAFSQIAFPTMWIPHSLFTLITHLSRLRQRVQRGEFRFRLSNINRHGIFRTNSFQPTVFFFLFEVIKINSFVCTLVGRNQSGHFISVCLARSIFISTFILLIERNKKNANGYR